jgi:hypothetical protein
MYIYVAIAYRHNCIFHCNQSKVTKCEPSLSSKARHLGGSRNKQKPKTSLPFFALLNKRRKEKVETDWNIYRKMKPLCSYQIIVKKERNMIFEKEKLFILVQKFQLRFIILLKEE